MCQEWSRSQTCVHHLGQAFDVVTLTSLPTHEVTMKALGEFLLNCDAIPALMMEQLEQQTAVRPTRDALDHDKGTGCPQCTTHIRLAVQGFDMRAIGLEYKQAPRRCRTRAGGRESQQQTPCERNTLAMCAAA